jgi:uncharacterized protein (TIGR03492 family)
MKLLVLSNGHGEDLIACKIIKHLRKEVKDISVSCLPLVGEGYAYQSLGIPMIAPVQSMPSGGFIYMETQRLWQDLRSGLMRLTISQQKAIKQWTKKGGVILAVGDIVPLLLAWLSGTNYAFVATAKSEYWLRDEQGWLKETSFLQRFWGSIYYPWERQLMTHSRCQAVFPRDKITTEVLQKYNIPAFDCGNPMMDDLSLKSTIPPLVFKEQNRPLIILLLPGSRFPEAERNWQTILEATESVMKLLPYQVIFLAAIAPALSLDSFQEHLLQKNWQIDREKRETSLINDPQAISYRKRVHQLILSQQAFSDCIRLSDLAIAMAGTATEQFVGFGKPAIAIPGKGPQYTAKFARNQALLLGISITIVDKPEKVPFEIGKFLKNPDFWQLIVENGVKRMGFPGASHRIAQCLQTNLLNS